MSSSCRHSRRLHNSAEIWTLSKGSQYSKEFHFGPKMVRRFEDAFLETFKAYARMCVSDGADDPEIVYTKAKVDQALQAACGDNIRPFDERYALENLYFRDKLMKEEK